MIANQDGHVSELRCSLPLHVLDNRLYDEAHAATLATRRLLLGARDVDGGQAVGTHGGETQDEEEEDLELPTYPDHVRDRVANAFLPETALMRMANPWVLQGVSPIIHRTTMSNGSSGMVSPVPIEPIPYFRNAPPAHDPLAQLPAVPSPDTEQLHWVNSELLLSLSSQPNERAERPGHGHADHTPPESAGQSRGGSRHGSRFPSRRGSRVIILGGTASISQKVVAQLKAMNLSVSRIQGKNRYELAATVAKQMKSADTAVIVNGSAYADAVAIAPYAAKQR